MRLRNECENKHFFSVCIDEKKRQSSGRTANHQVYNTNELEYKTEFEFSENPWLSADAITGDAITELDVDRTDQISKTMLDRDADALKWKKFKCCQGNSFAFEIELIKYVKRI